MFRGLLGFGIILGALLAPMACADQEEGQRCDPLNGNNDCASGLVCVKADKLALLDVGAICCPPAGQDENAVKECRAELQSGDGGAILPLQDSGAGGSSGAGNQPDATSDAAP
jgi:hypothetical protein